MAVWYVDLEGGSNSNTGASWAQALLNTQGIPTASLALGDEIRIAKSADPVLVGDATWTDGSTTVTLSETPTGLDTTFLVSRTSAAYWGEWPWHTVASVVGTTVTLNRKYRGPSGTFALYKRLPIRPTPISEGTVYLGFGATGNTSVLYSSDPGVGASHWTLSGGWDTSSNTRTGQTFVDGQTKEGVFFRVATYHLDISHLSFCRFGDHALAGTTSIRGVVEFDNILEGGHTNYVYGSGNNGTGDRRGSITINVTAGATGDGLHVHTSWNNVVTVNKIFDNTATGISQNNDYPSQSGGEYYIGETAYNGTYGIGGTGPTFNFVKDHVMVVEHAHHNTTGGVAAECTGANTWRITRANNNGTDLKFDGAWAAPGEDEYGDPIPQTDLDNETYKQTVIGSTLESTTQISNNASYPENPFLVDIQGVTIQQAPITGGVRLSGYCGADETIEVTGTGATIGTVTYPVDGTWQCDLTSIESGTHTFTADDGTYDASTDVVQPYIFQPTAASMSLAAGEPTVALLSAGRFKINGSAVPFKAWTGSEWKEASLRIWNGSEFVV